MVDLNSDFSSFKESPESKKPAFHVKNDWREQQKRDAKANGDLDADANPDTSLESNYFEEGQENGENYEREEDGTRRGSW